MSRRSLFTVLVMFSMGFSPVKGILRRKKLSRSQGAHSYGEDFNIKSAFFQEITEFFPKTYLAVLCIAMRLWSGSFLTGALELWEQLW
jgi:hypothetical protein